MEALEGGTARRWLGVRLERRLTLDGLDGFGDEAEAAQPRRPVARCPSPAAGQPRREEREACLRAAGRCRRPARERFRKVLRLALHAQQALVDDLGAALEAFGEFAHLLAQALVLLRQVLQRDGLSQGQAGKAAEEGADQRFPAKPPRIRPTSMKIHCMRRILDQEVPRSTDTCPGHPARAEPAPGVYSPHSRDSTHSDARPVASYLFLAMNWTTQAAPVWKRPSTTSRSISRASSTSHSGSSASSAARLTSMSTSAGPPVPRPSCSGR